MNKQLGTPVPHSDVVNKQPRTLLIGYGWVGQYVHKYFTEADYYTPSKCWRDKDGNIIDDQKNDRKYDVAFVSVPSPMSMDGSCDTSYVKEAIKTWWNEVDMFIVRSTVPPGTCEDLERDFDVPVVFQPEYVGETLGHPMTEPKRDPFIILGGKKIDTSIAAEYWSLVTHSNARIAQTDHKTAELCKYMENSFLATKVVFCNQFADLAKKMGLDYNELRELWLMDPRINRSHTYVYPDNPGFAGKCLPKDLSAISYYSRNQANQPLDIIESVLKINDKLRDKPLGRNKG